VNHLLKEEKNAVDCLDIKAKLKTEKPPQQRQALKNTDSTL